MKKPTKSQLSNLIFLVLIALFLFTPLRTTVSVWVNRIVAFNPSVIPEEKQKVLKEYSWTLRKTLENNEVYDFNQVKGEVVLVNLWATWCPPCIAEMPDLQELYNDYGDRVNFMFVTNESEKVVQSFFSKHGYQLPVYTPMTAYPEQLYSNSIPATFLIAKNGDIIIEKKGAASWNSKKVRKQLDALLAE